MDSLVLDKALRRWISMRALLSCVRHRSLSDAWSVSLDLLGVWMRFCGRYSSGLVWFSVVLSETQTHARCSRVLSHGSILSHGPSSRGIAEHLDTSLRMCLHASLD